MSLTRRSLLTRIGFATTGTVALAGCSGSSKSGGNASGDASTDVGGSTTDSSGTQAGGGTPSYDHEVKNELSGSVELLSQRAYTERNTLYVETKVRVTDADAIDGHLHLRTEVFYSKITAGNDVDILTEYESGKTYTLTTQFSDVDPMEVERYTLGFVAVSDDPPSN